MIAELNKFPVGWTECVIEDLVGKGGLFKDGDWVESKDQDPNGDVRLIQLADVGDASFIDKSSRFLTISKALDLKCTFLKAGDILVARMPDPLGRCCIFPLAGEKRYVTVVDVCAIRLGDSSIATKFIMYLINSPSIREKVSALQSGSTRKRISRGNLATIPLPLPPLNEQHRIVAKIETLFSELDNGIESLKTAREQLKVYRQAVLKHAFEGKLTDQPREGAEDQALEDLKLGDMLSFLTSGSRGWAEYYSSKGDIFIRAQNLNQDNLDLTNVAYVALPEKSEGKRTKVQAGDVLITITGANVTKTGFVKQDLGGAYVSQHVALCRPRPELNTEFLYWFLIAEVAGRRQLNEFAYGAGKPGLNLENIRSVKIRIPTIAKQQLIVERIKKQLSIEEDLASSITAEIQRIETLRQSILKKAFSGQLVPQDPNDEPASALLARIRAERDSLAAKPKTPLKRSPRASKAASI